MTERYQQSLEGVHPSELVERVKKQDYFLVRDLGSPDEDGRAPLTVLKWNNKWGTMIYGRDRKWYRVDKEWAAGMRSYHELSEMLNPRDAEEKQRDFWENFEDENEIAF